MSILERRRDHIEDIYDDEAAQEIIDRFIDAEIICTEDYIPDQPYFDYIDSMDEDQIEILFRELHRKGF